MAKYTILPPAGASFTTQGGGYDYEMEALEGLGVTSFGEIGEAFDPARHNAVMHVEEEGLGDNVIAEVFQKGFIVGEKVIRFAMVKVAN